MVMEYVRPILILLTVLVLFLGVRTAISMGWKHRSSKLLRTLGSLHLAVLLIAALAVLLGITTFLESSYGTDFVVRNIYRSWWFEIVLIGIWINIFSATILRFPFPLKKTGFVMTHIGILVLLIGSLMTRISGVEGTITLPEGQSSNQLALQGNSLKIHTHGTPIAPVDIPLDIPGKLLQTQNLDENGNLKVLIDEYHPHGELAHHYHPNEQASISANPAIHFEIRGQMIQLEKWLSLRNEDIRNPSSIELGPASIGLKVIESEDELARMLQEPLKNDKVSNPIVKVSLDQGLTFQEFAVNDYLGKSLILNNSAVEIKLTGFFKNAAVTDQFAIVESDDPGFNPAITFEITDNTPHAGHDDPGHKHLPHSSVRFQLHPEYQGSHKGKNVEPIVLLEGVEGGPVKLRGSLVFLVGPDGKAHYRVRSSKGQKTGLVELNKMVKLGWNDAVLVVKNLIPDAQIVRQVIPRPLKPSQEASLPFVTFRLISNNASTEPLTLLYSESRSINFEGQSIQLKFGEHQIPLPFELKLDDFRKIDYPNTTRAMSYESDVSVRNLDGIQDGVSTISTTISMNNVLDFRGWRFFQASYRIDGDIEYSTFQVAKDPGIETIYLGSIIMVMGIALMFWWKPEKRG